jgi:hypothetical protein
MDIQRRDTDLQVVRDRNSGDKEGLESHGYEAAN